MFVKPAVEGSVVRIPERNMRPLLQEGEEVAESQFWFRRILFGDVVMVQVPKPAKENKTNSKEI